MDLDWLEQADDWDSWSITLLFPQQSTRGRSHTMQPSPKFFPWKLFLEYHKDAWVFWKQATHSPCLALAMNLFLLQIPGFQFVWSHCSSDILGWVQEQTSDGWWWKMNYDTILLANVFKSTIFIKYRLWGHIALNWILSTFTQLCHLMQIRVSLIAHLVKNPPAIQKTLFNSLDR